MANFIFRIYQTLILISVLLSAYVLFLSVLESREEVAQNPPNRFNRVERKFDYTPGRVSNSTKKAEIKENPVRSAENNVGSSSSSRKKAEVAVNPVRNLTKTTRSLSNFTMEAEEIEKNPVKTIVLHSDKDREKNTEISKSSNISSQNQEKCNIPKLDINGDEVAGFFNEQASLNCGLGLEENWVHVDKDGKLRFIEARKSASCEIRYFWRENDFENKFGEESIKISDGFQMSGNDYATISCTEGAQKWESLLWDVNEVADVKKRAEKVKKDGKKRLNVYILGFDSISHMTFRRKLPKTVEFLEKTLGSVVLNGYNIVGDGTPQAYIPILTAKTEVELPLTRKRYPNANYVDDVYPFIWKNFSTDGYATMYAEDAFNIGTFTYRLKGFRQQPTDHFTRTFFKETEAKSKNWNCVGSIPLHRIWFNNARKFMKVYQDIPRFLLMHQSLLSHDGYNLVGAEDDDLSQHLAQMKEEGLFDDAIVIVMADHGHRFEKLRGTHQGQLEERMPFFSIALPESLKKTEHGAKMYKNLMDNKERLTSPFDIHSTLMDILNLPHEKIDFDTVQDAQTQRSLSLFRPIPSNRNCPQAGIDPHWCTCLSWQDAMGTSEDRELTRRLAQGVVREINKELEPEVKLCAKLKLAEIKSAKKLLPEKDLLAYKNVKDKDGFVADLSGNTKAAFAHYQLKIRTTPGKANYEVTIFYDIRKDEMKLDFGSISHVNKYGDDPHCIVDKNYYLATFCVCHDRV